MAMYNVNGQQPQFPWNAPNMNNNFMANQRAYGGMDQQMMNSSSQPGLSIVSINSDDQVTNYPVASGNTVAFVNFNTNRLCFKSTNVNGVPMPLRWATFAYDQEQKQTELQNTSEFATKDDLNQLMTMMQQTMATVNSLAEQQQFKNSSQQKKQDRN